MTHTELKALFEAQAEAARAVRNNAQAKMRAAIFTRLGATACNVPCGRLAELSELMRMAPIGFSKLLAEVGTTFMPRHAAEFVAGVVNRLQAQGSNSGIYKTKVHRNFMEFVDRGD